MEWTSRQLRAVVSIAERQNISHAAVELELTQPTVSRLLSRMEAEIGTALFTRDASGATPTEAGLRFVARAAEALRALDEVTDEVRSLDGQLTGKICVAMPETTGHSLFIPLIDRFAMLHPDVELRVMAAHPNGVPLALLAGDADVGVVSSAHKTNGLITEPLAHEQLHLVGAAKPGERKTTKVDTVTLDTVTLDTVALDTITLDEVADYPLALPAIQPGLRAIIDAAFAQRQLRPNVVLEVDADEALIELVSSGRAYSIMSFAGVQRLVGGGTLVARRIVDPPIPRLLSTAVPQARPTTRLMRAGIDIIHELAAETQVQAQWSPSRPVHS
ncbi:MAG: LysR family transcriptional regulator [Acidimicrobiales bacterium]